RASRLRRLDESEWAPHGRGQDALPWGSQGSVLAARARPGRTRGTGRALRTGLALVTLLALRAGRPLLPLWTGWALLALGTGRPLLALRTGRSRRPFRSL